VIASLLAPLSHHRLSPVDIVAHAEKTSQVELEGIIWPSALPVFRVFSMGSKEVSTSDSLFYLEFPSGVEFWEMRAIPSKC
jgi:hypothetical protein